jgi:hypothetical protein
MVRAGDVENVLAAPSSLTRDQLVREDDDDDDEERDRDRRRGGARPADRAGAVAVVDPGPAGVVPAEAFDAWASGVRRLYVEMTRITIEANWAKLINFETTIPQAVEDLVRSKQQEGPARREN